MHCCVQGLRLGSLHSWFAGPRVGRHCVKGMVLTCGKQRCPELKFPGFQSVISLPVSQFHGKCSTSGCKNNKDSVPDLQRFLSEIGTDPKEARFWLRQFAHVSWKRPFAVVEIDPEVFDDPSQLEHLASAVSFLQRNSLRPVLVFGEVQGGDRLCEQKAKAVSVERSRMLSDALSEQGLESCLLFAGSGVLQVDSDASPRVRQVNQDLIQWCLMRQAIPIIPSFGETLTGRIVQVRLWDVTSAVTRQLFPLKVIKVNCHGGFQNTEGQIIANINLPFDFEASKDESWCTEPLKQTVREVSELLTGLHGKTSVVITAADKVLQELFTHHGCGTFLKETTPLLKCHSLENVDVERLGNLLSRSFKKDLSNTYFEDIRNQVHTIFVSECYTAAAIICHVEGCDIPYLCKLAVSAQAQGEGTGDILWDEIRRNFSQLFWRARTENFVTPWYFKRSDGTWNLDSNWTVFWYGISDPGTSLKLIQKATAAPDSFR
ncbi:N-acetylglutamate synthase, mitochondrial-like isoform X2 [Babylonia areolata]|uniref:N-acetylglutamate synthase, mitochondrial-like isoform X2 n=1 Tax=Babylonia areolata TaxID=304850 RepID=UPI003FCEED99